MRLYHGGNGEFELKIGQSFTDNANAAKEAAGTLGTVTVIDIDLNSLEVNSWGDDEDESDVSVTDGDDSDNPEKTWTLVSDKAVRMARVVSTDSIQDKQQDKESEPESDDNQDESDVIEIDDEDGDDVEMKSPRCESESPDKYTLKSPPIAKVDHPEPDLLPDQSPWSNTIKVPVETKANTYPGRYIRDNPPKSVMPIPGTTSQKTPSAYRQQSAIASNSDSYRSPIQTYKPTPMPVSSARSYASGSVPSGQSSSVTMKSPILEVMRSPAEKSAPQSIGQRQSHVQNITNVSNEIIQHEQKHAAALRDVDPVAKPQIKYQRGIDGQKHAVSGKVETNLTPMMTPKATEAKAEAVHRSAMGDDNRSEADNQVGRESLFVAQQARQDSSRESLSNIRRTPTEHLSNSRTAASYSMQSPVSATMYSPSCRENNASTQIDTKVMRSPVVDRKSAVAMCSPQPKFDSGSFATGMKTVPSENRQYASTSESYRMSSPVEEKSETEYNPSSFMMRKSEQPQGRNESDILPAIQSIAKEFPWPQVDEMSMQLTSISKMIVAMKDCLIDNLPLLRELGVFLEDKFPELIGAMSGGGDSGGGGFAIELPPPFDGDESGSARGPAMPMIPTYPQPYPMSHVAY